MWYLGTRLVVQVIPGVGETLLHLVAGDTENSDNVALLIVQGHLSSGKPAFATVGHKFMLVFPKQATVRFVSPYCFAFSAEVIDWQ